MKKISAKEFTERLVNLMEVACDNCDKPEVLEKLCQDFTISFNGYSVNIPCNADSVEALFALIKEYAD